MSNFPAKFTTRIAPDLLADVRSLARKAGPKFPAVLSELRKHRNVEAQSCVQDAYLPSHDAYAAVYRKLAE